MALYDYMGALKLGRRSYQSALMKGEYPYLPVLDEILANTDIVSEVSLGLLDVPLEKIVGTKTQGRTQAFANNFMPLLGEKTEFGAKWAYLYDHQIEEGIHDPIIAYEFMNRYYVQEGNKRVSVLKYVHAYSITASVIRLIPKRSDDHDTKLYYEFLDFYQVSFNCDVWFSHEGSYAKLLAVMGKKPDEVWDEDTRMYFKAAYDLFSRVFHNFRTEDMEMTASDAFLIYAELFGYDMVKNRTEDQMKQDLAKIRDELTLTAGGSRIELVEQPQELEPAPTKLINWLKPAGTIEPEMLKIAFIHSKGKETSSWVYGHELGRLYLEQQFDGRLRTLSFENAATDDEIQQAIDLAIAAKCNMIFTTASQMIAQSVKAAIQHPEVRIFNCSVNMSYSSICTYYARMYESKFLMGALAAAMNEGNKLGYVADYPLYGTVSNINAFALGAKMINPRVKVSLKWSRLKEQNWKEELKQEGIVYISGDDLITPRSASREYGLYHKKADGSVDNLATPFWHWGKFYEQIVNLTCHGNPDTKSLKGRKAINYWWGMSADVIDVICSQNLPHGTNRLIDFLKKSIKSGSFHPFDGTIYSQEGVIQCKEGGSLTPEEIITMNWLAENVEGQIPDIDSFTPEAQALVRLQGVKIEETATEEKKREDSGTGRS